MLGFWKLRQKIQALDYRSWSRVGQVLEQLEAYSREARKLRDTGAVQVARETWESWLNDVEAGLAARAKELAQPSSSRRPNDSFVYPEDTLGEKPMAIHPPVHKTPNSLQAINLTRTRTVLRSFVRIFV